MTFFRKSLVFSLLLCSTSHAAMAQDAATPAPEYTLFNPVPDDKLRPMSTERPSKTDSTTTLDAGRYQIETNIVAYTYNDDCIGGTCTTTKQWYGAGSTNLRIGLTQASDFQIIVDAYRDLTVSDKTAGTRDESNGFGDTLLRYKYNFFGNDGGEWALAGLAFVKLPTNQDNLGNDDVEAGFELPFNWNFAEGWSFGGMTQVNLLRDSAPGGSDYYGGYVNSLIVTRSFTEKWSGYGELWTFKTDISPHWQSTADFGVIYAVNDALRVDTGINLGISDAADDVNWFAGFAYRF